MTQDGKPACGWPLRGDPKRPCVLALGHGDNHRDARTRKYQVEQNRRWYQENHAKVAERRLRDRREHPLRLVWQAMKQRCFNPKTRGYPRYGGRGITVYPPWCSSFRAFEAWVNEHLGPRPSAQHSLDRIDNDGNYEPGNLRWADHHTQAANRRPWLAQARIPELEARIAELEAEIMRLKSTSNQETQ